MLVKLRSPCTWSRQMPVFTVLNPFKDIQTTLQKLLLLNIKAIPVALGATSRESSIKLFSDFSFDFFKLLNLSKR